MGRGERREGKKGERSKHVREKRKENASVTCLHVFLFSFARSPAFLSRPTCRILPPSSSGSNPSPPLGPLHYYLLHPSTHTYAPELAPPTINPCHTHIRTTRGPTSQHALLLTSGRRPRPTSCPRPCCCWSPRRLVPSLCRSLANVIGWGALIAKSTGIDSSSET